MRRINLKVNNQFNLSHLRLPITLVVFLLFAFSFSEIVYAADKHGGVLVLSTTSDPRSFNPMLAKETSTTAVTGLIFEGLTRTNGITLEVEPNLAKKWDVSEDGLVWTFYLRDDVFWFDQNKFNADDVIFTFNDLIFNPKVPNSSRDIFTIGGQAFIVEKIDDFTVRFILPVKFAPFLRAMGQEILPRHILESKVKEGKFNFTWGTDTELKDIIGTGPFKLSQYLPGEKITLERNLLYWRRSEGGEKLPYLDKVIFLIVQSQDTALLKFKDGELDYFGLRGADYPLLKPEEKKQGFTIYEVGPAFGSNFLVFNLNPDINPQTNKPFVEPKKLSWFSNLNFRRAVAHAIDKKRIIDIFLNGLGFPQYSDMSPSAGFFYNPDVKKYNYDLKKAKEILRSEGFYDRNNDGIIEDKDLNKIEFNLYTNSGASERIQIAGIVRKDLEDLGIKVNFQSLEFNNLVGKLVSNYDWDAVIIGLTGGVEPHFGRNVWHSSGHLHMWHPGQSSPQTEWEGRINEIFDQGVQELDPNKRKILYDEWQAIISDELPVIYTVLSANIFAVRNKFGNLHPSSFGGAFHNLDEIYLKEEYK